jgi:hypothetical protein
MLKLDRLFSSGAIEGPTRITVGKRSRVARMFRYFVRWLLSPRF